MSVTNDDRPVTSTDIHTPPNVIQDKNGKKKILRVSKQKREVFVEEYLRTLNATKAALKAGYTPQSARSRGHDLLNNPDIKAEIEMLLAQRHEQCMVDVELILQGLKDIALDTKFPAKDRVKAFDLLGRYTSMWLGGNEQVSQSKIEIHLVDPQ